MVSVSASVNLPLHYKVQKFFYGTGSHRWSRKKGCKMVVCVCDWWTLRWYEKDESIDLESSGLACQLNANVLFRRRIISLVTELNDELTRETIAAVDWHQLNTTSTHTRWQHTTTMGTDWKERKGRVFIWRFFWPRWYTQSAQAWITQFYLQTTACLPFLRERSPDVTTTATEAADIQLQLTTHLSTSKGWQAELA